MFARSIYVLCMSAMLLGMSMADNPQVSKPTPSPTGIPGLSNCVGGCVSDNAASYEGACDISEPQDPSQCLCESSELWSTVSQCISQFCTPDDAQQAAAYFQQQCGAPVLTGADTATGTSAASITSRPSSSSNSARPSSATESASSSDSSSTPSERSTASTGSSSPATGSTSSSASSSTPDSGASSLTTTVKPSVTISPSTSLPLFSSPAADGNPVSDAGVSSTPLDSDVPPSGTIMSQGPATQTSNAASGMTLTRGVDISGWPVGTVALAMLVVLVHGIVS
ncbi:hypothetical protein BD414DRAFT_495302 [Trametes punicea]|nr:hypothetical protein BD414DRAFT_495302 [Trametes punicea]